MAMHHKKLQRILTVYIGILLLVLAVVYMIPDENFLNHDIATPEEIDKAKLASGELYKAAKDGRPEQVEGAFVNGQWSFKYTGKGLKITTPDNNSSIIVERKNIDDGKIEVVSYLTATIVDKMNFTSRIEVPKVALEGNELLIKSAAPIKVEFLKFRKDFTAVQFSGDNAEQDRGKSGITSVMGQQLLYLRVPKNLQIDDAKFNIQMVGEE